MSRFHRFATVFMIAIGTLLSGSRLVADEASEALSKFREPVDVAVDKALKFLAEVQKDDFGSEEDQEINSKSRKKMNISRLLVRLMHSMADDALMCLIKTH